MLVTSPVCDSKLYMFESIGQGGLDLLGRAYRTGEGQVEGGPSPRRRVCTGEVNCVLGFILRGRGRVRHRELEPNLCLCKPTVGVGAILESGLGCPPSRDVLKGSWVLACAHTAELVATEFRSHCAEGAVRTRGRIVGDVQGGSRPLPSGLLMVSL
jgi:hypothetical protein